MKHEILETQGPGERTEAGRRTSDPRSPSAVAAQCVDPEHSVSVHLDAERAALD